MYDILILKGGKIMNTIPLYNKILTLGSYGTQHVFMGDVIIQEKIDGSQFSFGLNKDNVLIFRSRRAIIYPEKVEDIFMPAVKYVLSIEERIKSLFHPNTYFRTETLEKPKHNVLSYDRCPKNHMVLFDVQLPGGELITDRKQLKDVATQLNIDVIPELFRGSVLHSPVEFMQQLIEKTQSYLGGQLVEGAVVKNYNQIIVMEGHSYPLFIKYVREEFKESHKKVWEKESVNKIEKFIGSFTNSNRWEKAVMHLKEQGQIENKAKDIGKLIVEIQQDVAEECKEDIKQFFYSYYIKKIQSVSCYGLPQWYKNKLTQNME